MSESLTDITVSVIRRGSSAPAHLVILSTGITMCGLRAPMGMDAISFGAVVCKNCLREVVEGGAT